MKGLLGCKKPRNEKQCRGQLASDNTLVALCTILPTYRSPLVQAGCKVLQLHHIVCNPCMHQVPDVKPALVAYAMRRSVMIPCSTGVSCVTFCQAKHIVASLPHAERTALRVEEAMLLHGR